MAPGTMIKTNIVCRLLLAAILLSSLLAQARDSRNLPAAAFSTGLRSHSAGRLAQQDSSTVPIPWPTLWASLQTGKINAIFGTSGTFGLPFSDYQADYPFWPRASLESPPGSGFDFLFGGAIWVGGIIGNDTLVSAGNDGWFNARDFYPDNYRPDGPGSIQPFDSVGNLSLQSKFTDTIQAGIPGRPSAMGGVHLPLHIALINRAHVWTAAPFNHALIYDLVITNIGSQTIHNGYVGMYVDGDIEGPGDQANGARDDIVGSIRNRGLGYIVDNNGDPVNGTFNPATSPRSLLGFKFLASSFQPRDTSFNWWFGYQSLGDWTDFGPQRRAHFRPFGLGGGGQPLTDADRYFLLSGGEWDYDQVQTASISPDDSIWVTPPSAALQWCQGEDVRFLLSIGPFDLQPDSSVRFLYTYLVGDSVHSDPHILDYLPLAPDLYTQTLNFKPTLASADAADSLGRLVIAPDNPSSGLKVSYGAGDSLKFWWDPWCFDNIDGYNVYLTPIPDSAYDRPGVLPIWYQPNTPQLWNQVGRGNRLEISGLSSRSAYAVSLSSVHGGISGTLCAPLLIKPGFRSGAPLVIDTMLFTPVSGSVEFQWTPGSSAPPHHYNIYRFPDSISYARRFLPFYSADSQSVPRTDSVVKSSRKYYYFALPVLAQVPGNQNQFSDSTAPTGSFFCVTAVDSSGFESDFSAPAIVTRIARSKDILVMSNGNPSLNFVYSDSVRAFYAQVLNGYAWDFYSLIDTLQKQNCPGFSPGCVDWHDLLPYRTVIIDDGLSDDVLTSPLEQATGAFTKYLQSGGRIAYFGSFTHTRTVPLDPNAQPGFVSIGSAFASRYFGIDSVYYVGLLYYSNLGPVVTDPVFAFKGAAGGSTGIPSVTFDSLNTRFSQRLRTYWPQHSAPIVSVFKPNARGVTTHLFLSSRPATSPEDSLPVGVLTTTDSSQTYAFGFHLWYMKPTDARQLIDWMTGGASAGRPINSPAGAPTQFALVQNYPNPFNPTTRIGFDLPQAGLVTLTIYNILGQHVRTLINASYAPGKYQVTWDGRDERGGSVASGIYLYRLQSLSMMLSRKMLLLR